MAAAPGVTTRNTAAEHPIPTEELRKNTAARHVVLLHPTGKQVRVRMPPGSRTTEQPAGSGQTSVIARAGEQGPA